MRNTNRPGYLVTAILLSAALLLSFALPAAAEPTPMEPFDYTDDLLEDGSPIYYFQELSLTLPAEWHGKVMALRQVNGTSFYQKASYDKYQEEGINGGGFLFELSASVNGSFSELPAFRYLGFSEESAMNYFLILPTDYPAYMDDDIRAEYDMMSSQIDLVVNNVDFYHNSTEDHPDESGPAIFEDGNGLGDEDIETANLDLISCPELGFTTKADPLYSWEYEEDTGIYIYTEDEGSIPYVLVYQGEDLIVEAFEYIQEQYTPYMQDQYGDDLVEYEETRSYPIGGKELPAGLYTYRLQGHLVKMIRIYDSTGKRTVAYSAKYLVDDGETNPKAEETLAALDTAVRYFKAD